MNIVNRIKLKSYPELQKMNFDEETLIKIISNKNFKEQYQKVILPFISKYKDNDMIKGIFELSISNDSEKFANFVDNNYLHNEKEFELDKSQKNTNNDNEKTNSVESIWDYFEEVKRGKNNYAIIKDKNFDKLFSILKFNVFDESMTKILNKIDSDKLLQIDIGNKNILEYVSRFNKFSLEYVSNLNRLRWIETIISNDFVEGLKYTYDNISKFQGEMDSNSSLPEIDRQFSMDFITNVGNECLEKMYKLNIFNDKSNQRERDTIFKIANKNNYELIYDIMGAFTFYETYNDVYGDVFYKNISDDDLKKSYIELLEDKNIKGFILKKYMIPKLNNDNDKEYQNLLNSILSINDLPKDFTDKYDSILSLSRRIMNSSNEELIEIFKGKNLGKDRNEYNKQLETNFSLFMKDANEILKKEVVTDLKTRSNQIIQNSKKTNIISEAGKNIDVYELTGEPFTMLAHCISENGGVGPFNKKVGAMIIENPEQWITYNRNQNANLSTSLVSNKSLNFAFKNAKDTDTVVIYGFDNLENVELSKMLDKDMGTSAREKLDKPSAENVNPILLLDDLNNRMIGKKLHNEILISRVDKDGNKIKPNYIICDDIVKPNSIKAAEYFDIPIYLIHTDCYAFDRRTKKEEEIANDIREKNERIAKEKEKNIQMQTGNSYTLNKGYINIIIMSLVVITITILVIMYLKIK